MLSLSLLPKHPHPHAAWGCIPEELVGSRAVWGPVCSSLPSTVWLLLAWSPHRRWCGLVPVGDESLTRAKERGWGLGTRRRAVWGARSSPCPPQCVLQAQNQELEELNKELRQCNLQQFIQQTGATVTVGQARSEEDAQPEPSPRELPACRRNGGQHAGSARGAALQPQMSPQWPQLLPPPPPGLRAAWFSGICARAFMAQPSGRGAAGMEARPAALC